MSVEGDFDAVAGRGSGEAGRSRNFGGVEEKHHSQKRSCAEIGPGTMTLAATIGRGDVAAEGEVCFDMRRYVICLRGRG